jgi:enterobacterial common antigen flippase
VQSPQDLTPETNRPAGKQSYGQILKSSALIGGSSMLNVGISVIRTKAMAVILGPTGFGLMGLYTSVFELVRGVTGMGVSSSGVRQIAEAVGSQDEGKIARTVAVLRRVSLWLGLFGGLVLVAACQPISWLTFGDTSHAWGVGLLSLAVFFRLISDGQGALIQGMRRIGDLARMSIWGAVIGTITTIPLVYFFREDGVVLALVAMAGFGLLVSWFYSKKIKVQAPVLSGADIRREGGELLKLGVAFMVSNLMMLGAAYLIRVMVMHASNLESAGFYQASWTLGGMYVGFVLQAMGADFFPRLTAVATDHAECNRLVNEQTLVSLLLAGPGIIATLTFAPVVIALFYTGEFQAAVPVLRWICLGMALRIIIWPMGFIVLAKGARNFFFLSEVVWATAHLGLGWVFLQTSGLVGAGMAFFGSYVVHGILVWGMVRSLTGFKWSPVNRLNGLLFLVVIGVVFCGLEWLPGYSGMMLGTVVVILSSVYSLRMLCRLVPMERMPGPVRKLLVLLRLAPPAAGS